MAMESKTNEEGGVLKSALDCVKALPCNIGAKVVKVAKNIKKIGQEDPRRVIHSFKVGLALTLVSLLYYSRSLYDGFGVAGMWAVLTVVVVFEFTVGGTLSKSLNRGFATLVAGALGVGAQHFASLFGKKGEPIVLGILVFLLAAASTFTRFFPRIKARYDYGVLIFVLTFSLVSVSGYRIEELVSLAHQRILTIVIGGVTCIVVSICICPVWAGEDLHNSIASNIEKLANYLEGFAGEYFHEHQNGGESKKNKSFLQGYKVILNSKSREESMANLAIWEPRHGRFGFMHPWKQYLKIGDLSRQCAYQIEALNGYINSDVQVPEEFQNKIQEPCKKMSEESSKALKLLTSSIKSMINPSNAEIHVESSKKAVQDLEISINSLSVDHGDLLAIMPAATVASILIEIVKIVDKFYESVNELSKEAHFKNEVEATVSQEIKPPQLVLHRGTIKPVLLDSDSCSSDHHHDHVIKIDEILIDRVEENQRAPR